MGIAALRKLLAPGPLDLAKLRGQVVAVDADNMVWQFVTGIAGAGRPLPTGQDGLPNAHLIGLTNRLRLYAGLGLRSAWIFDGEQPQLKQGTIAAREARVAEAGTVWVGEREMAECRALLEALGVPSMVAPGESDAQCAHLARSGAAWAAVTQDWDIALHGAPRAIRNLTGSATRPAELLDLDASLAAAGLTRDMLVDVALLIGTDYNEGIPGVGPVKALALVKRHGGAQAALRALGASIPDLDAVRALFLAHPVDAAWRPTFGVPDVEAVGRVLSRAGLGGARADAVTAAVAALHA